MFVRVGVIAALVVSVSCSSFPRATGRDSMIAQHQPRTLAAMEGLFETQPGAPLVIIGQPDIGDAEDRQSDRRAEACSAS